MVSNFALRLLLDDEQWVKNVMGGEPTTPNDQALGLWLDDRLAVGAPPAMNTLSEHLGVEPSHGRRGLAFGSDL